VILRHYFCLFCFAACRRRWRGYPGEAPGGGGGGGGGGDLRG